jgi:signal transduction histidine kinase
VFIMRQLSMETGQFRMGPGNNPPATPSPSGKTKFPEMAVQNQRTAELQKAGPAHFGATKIAAFLATFSFVLTVELLPGGPLQAARDWLFDTYQWLDSAERDGSRSVVVEIDDESIRRIGSWPWPRDKLAALVDTAHDASAVGLDILLPDADRFSPAHLLERLDVEAPGLRRSLLELRDPDRVLAAALRSSPTVLAMTEEDGRHAGPEIPARSLPIIERGAGDRAALLHFDGARWPLAQLMDAAHGAGFVSARPRASGVIDRLPAVSDFGGSLLPGFATALVATALKADRMIVNTGPAGVVSVEIEGLTIQADASGQVRPRFVGTDHLVRMPAYRLLDPLYDRSALQGRIVVIGVTARGAGDTYQIPLGIRESGAAIQAELIDSMLSRDMLWRPALAPAFECGASLMISLTMALMIGRGHDRAAALAFGGIVPALLLIPGLLFRKYGLLIDCISPLVSLFATAFVFICIRVRTEISARRRIAAELAFARVQQAAERREAELESAAEALQQSLTFAVAAARLGVWDADMKRGTWHHSAQHDAILGLDEAPSEWTPAVVLDRVVAEDRDAAREHFADAEASGTLQMECRIKRSDGSIRAISLLGRVWRDADGRPRGSAGVIADITQQREMESRLREGEKMQAVGLLAAGVAHNFNNLLTVVIGSLELAQGRLDRPASMRSLIADAIAAAQKSTAIARQLLAFARLQPLRPSTAEPAELVRTVGRMLESALPGRIRVEADVAPDVGAISVDLVEFELALLNLGMNARDAMPNGGRITLAASESELSDAALGLHGRYLIVEMTDSGEGIPPDQLPRVFDPFFTTKDPGKGCGLGLSQVYGFCHQSGGTVGIDSTPGRGTTVRLYLPSDRHRARAVPPLSARIAS